MKYIHLSVDQYINFVWSISLKPFTWQISNFVYRYPKEKMTLIDFKVTVSNIKFKIPGTSSGQASVFSFIVLEPFTGHKTCSTDTYPIFNIYWNSKCCLNKILLIICIIYNLLWTWYTGTPKEADKPLTLIMMSKG